MFTVEEVPSRLRPHCEILALGSDTRRRISWTDKNKIFSLGPKDGLMPVEDFYHKAAGFLSKKFRLKPKILAFDPHPLFVSSAASGELRDRFFKRASLIPVFHHVAHVANFGIEVEPRRKFIGLAFDGTGFGEDKNIWGGEFFVYERSCFKRAAHFEYQALPGNEAAILEPWRIAFAILCRIYGREISRMRLGFLERIPEERVALVRQMVAKKFNAPLTSSAGRLFDAVCALLGLKTVVRKEGEAAVALERSAAEFGGKATAYKFVVKENGPVLVIGLAPMFKQIVSDMRQKKPAPEIAYCFHLTLARIILHVCCCLRKIYAADDVFLSGGVFMNDILTSLSQGLLTKEGLRPYFAKRPATTDLGISQGQIAACVMAEYRGIVPPYGGISLDAR